MPKDAMLYHKPEGGGQEIICDLCHHRCTIQNGGLGICRARRNDDGRLQTLVYGRCIAMTPDPIEKKPLFHFLPGTQSLSVATVGCNFTCDFCQNHHISQFLRDRSEDIPGDWVEPESIVRAAKRAKCWSLSFTYTEPTVFFEYAYETARLAQEENIRTCFVSNGYMTPEAVYKIAPCLDAINVDLKSFNKNTYRKIIGGQLDKVLETIQCLYENKIWIEITTLLIEGVNDHPDEIRRIARFIADLSPDVPWHVSRFHPQYKMNAPPATSPESVILALQIGREEGLRHIYCGNMRDGRTESTWCHQCGSLLIARSGYFVSENNITADGACPACKTPCAGLW